MSTRHHELPGSHHLGWVWLQPLSVFNGSVWIPDQSYAIVRSFGVEIRGNCRYGGSTVLVQFDTHALHIEKNVVKVICTHSKHHEWLANAVSCYESLFTLSSVPLLCSSFLIWIFFFYNSICHFLLWFPVGCFGCDTENLMPIAMSWSAFSCVLLMVPDLKSSLSPILALYTCWDRRVIL